MTTEEEARDEIVGMLRAHEVRVTESGGKLHILLSLSMPGDRARRLVDDIMAAAAHTSRDIVDGDDLVFRGGDAIAKLAEGWLLDAVKQDAARSLLYVLKAKYEGIDV